MVQVPAQALEEFLRLSKMGASYAALKAAAEPIEQALITPNPVLAVAENAEALERVRAERDALRSPGGTRVRLDDQEAQAFFKVLSFALHAQGNSAQRLADFTGLSPEHITHLIRLAEDLERGS